MLRRCLLLLAALPLWQAGIFVQTSACAQTSTVAQTSTCQSLQNQLAALGRSGGGRAASYASAAQRQIDEIQRTAAYARQIGCGNSRFLVFGSDPPAACGELMARISRMQANLASLQQKADELGGGESALAHRARLEAAIRQYCDDPRRPGGFEPLDPDHDPLQSGDIMEEDQAEAPDQGLAPGKPVCVRLCDGYFFPLASLGKGGPDAAAGMCQAQCPGAETQAFSMGASDDIAQAVGPGGKRYIELDNALRYQRATVSGCSCRRANESWGQALKGAEDMLGTGDTDVPVSADKAAELSRVPQPGKAPAPGKSPQAGKTPDKKAASVAGQPPAPGSAPATGGAPAAGPASGQRQTVGPDGTRNVRIIAPPAAPSNQP